MKGTIQEFLKLVAEDPELARRLGQLAREFGFEFSDGELTEEEMEGVAGGTTSSDSNQTSLILYSAALNAQSQIISTMSRILKSASESQDSVIRNIRG